MGLLTVNIALSSLTAPGAKSMSSGQKKRVALEAVCGVKTVTRIAQENSTSRQFIRRQAQTLQTVIDKEFTTANERHDDVIFYLPVTKKWIEQLVLALMLVAHASYRNIITILQDVLDYDLSLGSIHNIFSAAVQKAKAIQATECLSGIEVTANDELFHRNKPILSGIDSRSLYCYLLSSEDRRDEDTWAIHLLDAQDKGLRANRTIGDDASGLVSGHALVFPNTPYDYDNFHLSRALKDLRRFYRNRLKTAITVRNDYDTKAEKMVSDLESVDKSLSARAEETRVRHISSTIDTLVSWLEHDILNKAGPTPDERRELYDFVVQEFKALERLETHRIKVVRITLENKWDMVLRFSDELAEKFEEIAQRYNIPIESVWAMCQLQRCDAGGDQYFFRSLPLQELLGDRYDNIEEAVMEAMDKTERTSSMVENLNGRVRVHIRHRQEIGSGYLDLLRFFMNHSPLVRSARVERQGKSPAEILSGKLHPHWLEMLGYQRFQRTV